MAGIQARGSVAIQRPNAIGFHMDVYTDDLTAASQLLRLYIIGATDLPSDDMTSRMNAAIQAFDHNLQTLAINFELELPKDFNTVRTVGASDVINERNRQVEIGFDAENDDAYKGDTMIDIAVCYARGSINQSYWPFGEPAFKDKGPRQNLVRAAALLIAEIDRLDRGTARVDTLLKENKAPK